MARPDTLNAARATLFSRCTPFLCLLPPVIASAGLISMQGWRDFQLVRNYVEDNRTTVSVLIQLISSVMAILQTATLTLVINYSARIRLARSPMRLDTVGLFTALSVPRVPWNLPLKSLAIAIFVLVATQVLGALWAGGITPFTVQQAEDRGSVMVPAFTEDTRDIWDSEFAIRDGTYVWNYVQNCTAIRGQVTSVSNCPVPNYQSALLDAAREATSSTGAPKNHSKPDNPTWTYHGRSYGVGSPQGLRPTQDIPPDFKLISYSYNETGYLASVSCQHNNSANISFQWSQRVDNVDIWEVKGRLPNSKIEEFYPVMAWLRDNLDEAPVLAWAAVSNEDTSIIGVVASALYGDFNKLQCSIELVSTKFTIRVNSTDQSMVVFPVESTPDTLDPTGHLKNNAVWSVNLLSRMSSSLYVSILGEALQYNFNSTKSGFPGINNTEAVLKATEDSFEAILDDTLGIYGGAQLILADSSGTVPIAGKFAAIRIGQPWYQWAIAVINLGLLLLIIGEGLRTKWWRCLPQFDILDFKSIVAASSSGGNAIAREANKRHQKQGSRWIGDSQDRLLGEISVCLQEVPAEPALVLSRRDSNGDEIIQEDGQELEQMISDRTSEER